MIEKDIDSVTVLDNIAPIIESSNKSVMANNIKRYLQQFGKTQKELCETLGFKETTVSSWMSGKSYPRIDRIEKMAKYFGVKKADLIEDHLEDVYMVKLNKKEKDLIQKYRKLDIDIQEDIDDYLNVKLEKYESKIKVNEIT